MNVFTSLNISLLLNVDRVSTGFELSIFLTEKAVKVSLAAGKVFCTALRHKWLRSEKSVSVDVINLLGSCARPAIGELVALTQRFRQSVYRSYSSLNLVMVGFAISLGCLYVTTTPVWSNLISKNCNCLLRRTVYGIGNSRLILPY